MDHAVLPGCHGIPGSRHLGPYPVVKDVLGAPHPTILASDGIPWLFCPKPFRPVGIACRNMKGALRIARRIFKETVKLWEKLTPRGGAGAGRPPAPRIGIEPPRHCEGEVRTLQESWEATENESSNSSFLGVRASGHPHNQRFGTRGLQGRICRIEYRPGHQVPLASFTSTHDWEATNYLSNITPQKSALNRGPWLRLESATRTLARQPATEAVFAMTGPLYEREMPTLPGADESHRVPSGYWKIIATDERGVIRIAAFLLDQDTERRASSVKNSSSAACARLRTRRG